MSISAYIEHVNHDYAVRDCKGRIASVMTRIVTEHGTFKAEVLVDWFDQILDWPGIAPGPIYYEIDTGVLQRFVDEWHEFVEERYVKFHGDYERAASEIASEFTEVINEFGAGQWFLFSYSC